MQKEPTLKKPYKTRKRGKTVFFGYRGKLGYLNVKVKEENINKYLTYLTTAL